MRHQSVSTSLNDTIMSPISLYTFLNPARSEIRLLEIVSQGDETPSCKLTIASLQDQLVFAALSYVWGDASIVEGIVVNGQVVSVTKNLAAALRHVRKSWAEHFPDRDPSSFRLWADAICINQQDMPERGSQVQQMGLLYKKADVVLAWLGDCRKKNGELVDIPAAFDVYKTLSMAAREFADRDKERLALSWMQRHPELYQNPDGTPVGFSSNPIYAALELNQIQYWTRAWIMQEVVLSGTLLLCTEDTYLDLEDLESSMSLLHDVGIKWESLQRPAFLPVPIWALLKNCYRFRETCSRITNTRRIHLEPRPDGRLAIGWHIASWGSSLRATDPKDHIYALLALRGVHSIVPCYEKHVSVRRVYRDYVALGFKEFYHSTSGSPAAAQQFVALSFLNEAGIGRFDNPLRLPTWAPNFPERSQQDDSVPPLLPGRASLFDDRLFPSPSAPPAIVRNYTLRCAGVEVEAITHLSDVIRTRQDPIGGQRSMINFFHHFSLRHDSYISGVHPLRAFFRTLLRRYDDQGIAEEDFIHRSTDIFRLLQACCRRSPNLSHTYFGTTSEDRFVDTMRRGLPVGYDANSNPMRPYEEAYVDAAVELNKLGECRLYETSSGYIGVTGKNTLKGDVVCLLKSFLVPVVMRRESEHYLFVGPSLVTGLMTTDEFNRYVMEERHRIQSFFIR